MSAIDEFLAESAAVCAKASKAPWKFVDGEGRERDCVMTEGWEATGTNDEDDKIYEVCALPSDLYGYACNFHENGQFIAFARTAIPKYERLVRELMAEVREGERLLVKARTEIGCGCDEDSHSCDYAAFRGLAAVESRWSGERGGAK